MSQGTHRLAAEFINTVRIELLKYYPDDEIIVDTWHNLYSGEDQRRIEPDPKIIIEMRWLHRGQRYGLRREVALIEIIRSQFDIAQACIEWCRQKRQAMN
jgi:hypothetical protein